MYIYLIIPIHTCSQQGSSTKRNESYKIHQLSPTYTPDAGQYDVVDRLARNQGASVGVMQSSDLADGLYDTIDHKPSGRPHTKTEDPQPADEHTYSVIADKSGCKPQRNE